LKVTFAAVMTPKFSEPVLKMTEEAVSEADEFICKRKALGAGVFLWLQRPVVYWLNNTPLSVMIPVPVTGQVRLAPAMDVKVSE